MHAVVKGAVGLALWAALSPPPNPARAPQRRPAMPKIEASRCPARTLPSTGADRLCIPLPPTAGAARVRALAAKGLLRQLRIRPEREQIARHPNRPIKHTAYVLPVSPVLAVTTDSHSDPAVVRVGLRVETEHGSVVTVARLEGEQGKPDVLLVGELYGITVVTRHRVAAEGGSREYLVFYGNLDRPGPHVVNGTVLSPMAVVGFVAQGRGGPHLYFEVRRLHRPLEGVPRHLSRLVSPGISVSEDVRNLLPLKK